MRSQSVRRRAWRVSMVTVPILVMGFLPSTAVGAEPISCGDVVTTDVTLTSDLYCPGSVGLVIGAPGVTVDMAGHTIAGDGSTSTTGVMVMGDFDGPYLDGTRVTDGTIRGFAVGVRSWYTTGSRLDRLTIAAARESGIVLHGAINVVAERNAVTTLNGADAGVTVIDSTGTVQRNAVQGRAQAGIVVYTLAGTVARNTANGTFSGAAIALAEGASPDGFGQTDILVDRNVATSSVGDGIFVGSFFSGTVLSRNTTKANGGDGIDDRGLRGVVADNLAKANAGLGISANTGAVDGGGNQAARNGDPAQCVNVTCS